MQRNLYLPIVLSSALVACDDGVVQPAEGSAEPAHAVLALKPRWEVFVVAAPNGVATANGINDAGVIVGTINDAGFERAFRYSAGTMTTWTATAQSWMTANDVNEAGQIVGSTLVNDTVRGYVRQASGDVDLLPYWGPPGTSNFAFAINDVGEVAGLTGRPGDPASPGDHVGLRWSVALGGWKLSLLGSVLDKPAQFVHDINNAGWIVGSVAEGIGGAGAAAFVHKPGTGLQLIGTLGGRSTAGSINSSGKVLGSSELPGGEPRAFSWTSFGGIRNEAAVSTWGGQVAISDKGRIAAYDRINGHDRAFTVYKGVHTVLPLLPNARSSYVRDVNTCGAIVGRMRMDDGSFHAVRWRRVVGTPPFAICD